MALTKGLLAPVGGNIPSVWSDKTTAGLLGGSPLAAPMPTYQQYTPQGGSKYGNYVRHWPDLLAAFNDPTNTIPNIKDWGKRHWDVHGSTNPTRALHGPSTFGVNPAISRGDAMDLGPSALAKGSSGLPMPDVEGYSYVYPRYQWDKDTGYAQGGVKSYETDINKYPYFPSMPQTGGQIFRDEEGKDLQTILLGVQLVPNSWVGK